MPDGTPETARRAAARTLVLRGALTCRVRQLERLVGRPRRFPGQRVWRPVPDSALLERDLTEDERRGAPGGWAKAGMPLDMTRQIRRLLADALRRQRSRQFPAAVRAYDAAERLYQLSAPTIRARRQAEIMAALAESERKRRVELPLRSAEANSRRAAKRARGWVHLGVQLREKHKDWSLSSIIAEIRRRKRVRLSDRQMHRRLKAAGVEVLGVKQPHNLL